MAEHDTTGSICNTCKGSGKLWAQAEQFRTGFETLCGDLGVTVERKGDRVGFRCPTCEGEGTAPEGKDELLGAATELLAMAEKALEDGDWFTSQQLTDQAKKFRDAQHELWWSEVYLRGSPEVNLILWKAWDRARKDARAKQTIGARLFERIKRLRARIQSPLQRN